MRLLLDTQVWLWALHDTARLSPETVDLLVDSDNEVILSAVVAWEISLKHALAKLTLPDKPVALIALFRRRFRSAILPIHISHAIRVAGLPHHHRDPFDRMLIAQAQTERLTILTADRMISLYDVPTLAA